MHGIGNDYIYVNCFEEKIDNPEKVSHEEVQKAAAEAQPKMTAIMKGLINEFKA